ncbi:MAG: right-handed parallel beta-helix repeat-containing protein [Methanobacterium sp.]|nr:right-handed parallel beta-helix repeat-containing protein [Methanobacterium sp.]
MVLTITTGIAFSEPVAAANHDVDSSWTYEQIQTLIDAPTTLAGDTITFFAGVYNDIALSITTSLNLVSNGAILYSNASPSSTSPVINILGVGASGTNVTGFTINGNGNNSGISASNTVGLNIENNNFNNTKRAVYLSNVNETSVKSSRIHNNTEYGIYIQDSGNLTSRNNLLIDGNTLINSTGGIHIVGSGISILNNSIDMYNQTSKNGIDGSSVYRTNVENGTFTTITNNIVNNNNFGIFLGGYFTGNVSDNTLNNSRLAAINSTGKHSPTIGSLNDNITNNNITNAANIGISMENPNVLNFYLEGNNIESEGFNVQYNQYYRDNGNVNIGDNTFSNSQNFIVNSTMTNDYIQSIIDGAHLGDTVTFLAGAYNNIALSVTSAVNMISNGAILNSDGNSPVISIIGALASGTNVTGFTINGNGTNDGVSASNTQGINISDNLFNNTNNAVSFSNVNGSSVVSNEIYNNTDYGVNINDVGNLTSRNNVLIEGNKFVNTSGGIWIIGSGFNISNNYMDMNYNDLNGISGHDVYSALIENNTLVNGDDGINIYMLYKNLTINKNTIINMTDGYADGISLVNHNNNKETDTLTTITNNLVDGNNVGIFLGGNFKGNISGNVLNNSQIAAMNITGKKAATAGSLNANITNNQMINAADLGISMENPNVLNLNLDDNNIESDGFSIQYNQYYRNNEIVNIGSGNTFSNPQNFIVNSTMTNSYIQSIIDGAGLGNTVTFLAGTYNNIALSVTTAVNLVSNGAILNNNGTSSTLSITGASASGTNVTGFTISGAGDNGISLDSVNSVTISNNTIHDNSNSGVALSDADNNVIKDNNINNNGEDGVYVESSTGNEIKDNNISNNDGKGVRLRSGANSNNITNNTINNNGEDGLYVKSSTGNDIKENTISENEGNGVILNDADGNNIKNNNIKNNNDAGVYVKSSTDNNITQNTITGNEGKGIRVNNADGNNITDNTINNNGETVTVTSTDPENNAVNISRDKVITVTFSDDIKVGTGWIELKNSSGAVVPITISINGNVLTITPSGLLAAGTKYTICIHTGSITDLVGNPVALISSKFTTTTDGTAPTVTTVDPANGATGVATDKVIKVTFSEDIKTGTGFIELKNSSGAVVPITTSVSGNVLTITPSSLLAVGTKYTICIHTGSVTDLSGNPVAVTSFKFTTVTA